MHKNGTQECTVYLLKDACIFGSQLCRQGLLPLKNVAPLVSTAIVALYSNPVILVYQPKCVVKSRLHRAPTPAGDLRLIHLILKHTTAPAYIYRRRAS